MEIKGQCVICGKETKTFCKSCSKTWGEFDPTYYCEEHYNNIVLTGNCCRGSEEIYS